MPLLVTACTVPLYGLWWAVFATGGGDLAAQVAWAEFARQYPGYAYNLFWYGGLHTANYSVISPYVMAAIGVVPMTLLSGLASSWLAGVLMLRAKVRRPLAPALVAAFCLWCQVVSGRSTFMLGVAFGLAAVVVLAGGHGAARLSVSALCAAVSTMASPVAGLFLVVVGAAHLLTRDGSRAASLLVPPVVVVALTTWLFPFKGEQPMPFGRIWPPVLLCAVILLTAPRAWRLLRCGAAVYALGVVLTFFVTSPVGTNVERLTELAAPPALLAIALHGFHGAEGGSPAGGPFTPRRRRAVCVVALCLSLTWLSGKTIADIRANTEVPAWAVRTSGVVTELKRLGAERTRVEVVPARDHREAAVLAPYINMARGWNRQADVERGRLFYDGNGGTNVPEGSFTSASYRAWLDHWAVGFVVLPKGAPDGPAKLEHALVMSEPRYLKQVWHDANWQIYRVRDAVPLVDPPASVASSDGANLVVSMPKAGSVTVRIAYSPWLWADAGCLAPSGEFTRLTVKAPGTVRISSAYGGPSGKGVRCAPGTEGENERAPAGR
ncbi:hypothetical protein GTY65_35285 [Streptomyces sp. SID8379]|uniref:hypothetical protein n=1 Tax=unclassified Streptomyces TaxID=2593676 RepID=UPI0005B96696|nr:MULTISPECIES: hypothetical protein [unclassified Streptomyces]MYW69295.1 hypothetical protein [Streptomyces sp. SID8379]